METNSSSLGTDVADANETSLIQEDLQEFKYYSEGVVLTPISVFGVIGNILSIYVLSCPEMKSNFNELLIGLASFDLVYLFLSLTIFSLPMLSSWYTATVLPHVMPIGYGCAHIGRVGSVFMTLSVTIERFFAIAYPLLNMELKNLLIYSSVGAAIIYNIPRFFELTTIGSLVYDEELKRNVTHYYFGPTRLRQNGLYVQIYVVWVKFILVELIPYVIIVVLNTFMIVRIRGAMRLQRQMTANTNLETQRKEMNMALVLVCIVIMFICCQSVKIIPDIYEAVVCDHSEKPCQSTIVVEKIVSVSYVLLGINSASNFIIYMLRGDKFRRVFARKMLQLCWRQNMNHFDSPRNGYSENHAMLLTHVDQGIKSGVDPQQKRMVSTRLNLSQQSGNRGSGYRSTFKYPHKPSPVTRITEI